MHEWWLKVKGDELAQGDLLPDCLFPHFESLTNDDHETGEEVRVELLSTSAIVMSQSCDLANNKVSFVALCPLISISEYAEANTKFKNVGHWENVRQGKQASLHLLASPVAPEDNMQALVADFGHIVSLPIGYLRQHSEELGDRWRLNSPYLEHFSQAFARFFMRVGLPSGIAPFKNK